MLLVGLALDKNVGDHVGTAVVGLLLGKNNGDVVGALAGFLLGDIVDLFVGTKDGST